MWVWGKARQGREDTKKKWCVSIPSLSQTIFPITYSTFSPSCFSSSSQNHLLTKAIFSSVGSVAVMNFEDDSMSQFTCHGNPPRTSMRKRHPLQCLTVDNRYMCLTLSM